MQLQTWREFAYLEETGEEIERQRKRQQEKDETASIEKEIHSRKQRRTVLSRTETHLRSHGTLSPQAPGEDIPGTAAEEPPAPGPAKEPERIALWNCVLGKHTGEKGVGRYSTSLKQKHGRGCRVEPHSTFLPDQA
ncbi:MAG: uncharacterized protein A8A55_2397 [Amphiamblys sp. WSBS2006]|nr:MAG: uncharacterized protein A8A55_2397 [Amphiamblys sp. WSBS2006]